MKKTTKVIRVITIPTNLFFIVLFLTYLTDKEAFPTLLSFIIPFIFIGCFVLVSYLVSFFIYKFKHNKEIDFRHLQRLCAFIFSFIGYLVAFVISLCCKFPEKIMILISTYFFSVCLLSLLNLLKIKASGHAAGIFGPLIFACYFINPHYIIPCTIIFILAMFASLYLKRHTISQFILGTICATIAFITSIIVF